jgi:hypothetical protein
MDEPVAIDIYQLIESKEKNNCVQCENVSIVVVCILLFIGLIVFILQFIN